MSPSKINQNHLSHLYWHPWKMHLFLYFCSCFISNITFFYFFFIKFTVMYLVSMHSLTFSNNVTNIINDFDDINGEIKGSGSVENLRNTINSSFGLNFSKWSDNIFVVWSSWETLWKEVRSHSNQHLWASQECSPSRGVLLVVWQLARTNL